MKPKFVKRKFYIGCKLKDSLENRFLNFHKMAYPISKLWAYPVLRVFIRKINGMENVPEKSLFIIAANHEKLADPLYIIYPILKKLNMKVHFLSTGRWWFFGDTICRKWAGCIPIFDRGQAYEEARKQIKSGEIVGFFPEGHLNAKKSYPKTGAVRLAIETKTPILPIGINSSYLPFNSVINIGKPFFLNGKEDIEKQSLDLIRRIYKLRDG